VTRLRTLTDELLVFARSPRISRRRADLNELTRNAIALCGEQADSARVPLRAELANGGAPLWAECDAERIQSVLVNLVQNAIEAVAFRDGHQPTAGRQVCVQTLPPAPGGPALATLAVEDSGPGIPDEARQHLFEPFFTTKRNGTGLGLATAQRFVGAHGGRIELQQGALPGARFAVLLPVGKPLAEAAGTPLEAT
jgi:signal transduction histidine kinase